MGHTKTSKMSHTLVQKDFIRSIGCCFFFIIIIFFATGSPQEVSATMLDSQYPGLTNGLLKSSVLEPMDDDILLIAGDLHFKKSQLLERIKDQEPQLRAQLEKNLFFILEQEATRQILLNEAQKVGISINRNDENQSIQAMFEQKTKTISVSDDEIRSFYAANKEMVGGAPFEQVADDIRQYMDQDKKQQTIANFIAQLGNTMSLRINKSWVANQYHLAMDNPVDKARNSGSSMYGKILIRQKNMEFGLSRHRYSLTLTAVSFFAIPVF
jgi:hypothetical protein